MIYRDYFEFNDLSIEITCDETSVLGIQSASNKDEILANHLTNKVKKQLDEYFKSERKEFDLPLIIGEDFNGSVYKTLLSSVAYGETISYKGLGELIDSKAYRLIGTAMSKNKYLIVIPCHRVIKSSGEIGNYKFGQDMKKYLLELEKR